MKSLDTRILNQYLSALEDACQTLEKKYIMKDMEGLERTKKFILELKSKIDEVLEG